MKSKVVSVFEALDLIKEGDAVAISAVGMTGYPEFVVAKLEERFIETKSPGGLTLYAAGGHGGRGHICDNRFAHSGFLKRHVCTHPKAVPELRELISSNEMEAYAMPQGVLNQLYRCTAARQPGLLTKIGIDTYIDPRLEGGKLNEITKEDLVRVFELDGEDWLFYKSPHVDIAIIRGTYADEKGNVTIDREALKLEMLEVALAAKGCGGKVIVQVEQVVQSNSLPAKNVVIPSQIVDAIVVTEDIPVYHRQANGPGHDPSVSGEVRAPWGALSLPKPEVSTNDIVCRRAVFELFPGAIINLGVGFGSGAGEVAAMEGIQDQLSFTLELGAFGGVPLGGMRFGVAMNPESYVSPPTMFDFYHGENLDVAVLGAAEVDKEGNVNVSRFAGVPDGQGGFIDISTSAKKAVFCTRLMAKGFKGEVLDGKLKILEEGKVVKFVDKVEQVTFSGKRALEAGHEIVYITERAVFKLTADGIMLTEIAPGVDLEKDILQLMAFKPLIAEDLKVMDARIFTPGKMGCFD